MAEDDSWEKFAKADPYWAVLTDSRYKVDSDGDLSPEAQVSFFKSGENHIRRVASTLETHFGRHFTDQDCCVDFGCGVGRLLIPMSRICGRAIGLDISATMRRLCLENALAHQAGNIECYSDLDRINHAPVQFDWVNSYIVFQHIATATGYGILNKLLNQVKRGGAISLHFTVYKDARAIPYITDRLRFFTADQSGIRSVVSNDPFYPSDAMMMNDYDVTRLYMIFQSYGFSRILTEHEDQDGMHGILFFSVKD
jgi:SAM-dependent methyltransferase